MTQNKNSSLLPTNYRLAVYDPTLTLCQHSAGFGFNPLTSSLMLQQQSALPTSN